jgi:prepilin-type N-terminal cleavage/methylation domain-containing protein
LTNKGFTILEILVALAIFAIGILGLAKMQVLSITGTSFNKDATKATAIAQRVIEEFKNASFGTSSSKCGATVDSMSVACSVSTNGTTPNRYNDITVTVSWNNKNISLFTIISER